MSAGMLVQCSIFESVVKNLTESQVRALNGNAIQPIAKYKAVIVSGNSWNENDYASCDPTAYAYPSTFNHRIDVSLPTSPLSIPNPSSPGGSNDSAFTPGTDFGIASQEIYTSLTYNSAGQAAKLTIYGPFIGVIAIYTDYGPVGPFGYPSSENYDSATLLNLSGWYENPAGPEPNSSHEIFAPGPPNAGGGSAAYVWIGLTNVGQIPIGHGLNLLG